MKNWTFCYWETKKSFCYSCNLTKTLVMPFFQTISMCFTPFASNSCSYCQFQTEYPQLHQDRYSTKRNYPSLQYQTYSKPYCTYHYSRNQSCKNPLILALLNSSNSFFRFVSTWVCSFFDFSVLKIPKAERHTCSSSVEYLAVDDLKICYFVSRSIVMQIVLVFTFILWEITCLISLQCYDGTILLSVCLIVLISDFFRHFSFVFR